MARKNILEGLMADIGTEAATPRSEAPIPEAFRRGPVAALEKDIRSSASRSVQEIDPDLIEDTGHRDRLAIPEEDVLDLRESISVHGQQVPILLRPHPRISGRYQVVYGRRRLAAIRPLGIPVKALVRTISDEEAVLAQGQENNFRKDPSFIEKALFAGELEDADYPPAVIRDALAVGKSHLSHMRKVREAIPRPIVERIGAAPSVGWKRWHQLAERLLASGTDPSAVHPGDFGEDLDSDKRFEAYAAALERLLAPGRPAAAPRAKPRPVTAANGSRIGEILTAGGRTILRTDPKETGFAQWLESHGEEALLRLHAEWANERTG
ncbi:plasmid partitioning protein RepB [Defluviimonas salinarum]|uniref:Plasmid partitioning protein RepB n=1 Tax=Defluviimonas salinarum TaxID=2992147 RepID=A0ABT3J9U0_9RHOB|nr:plasmid partitioning protein RepB [Defluviimonas salinarum]MCW3784440.1 plasmid partitioning protein RepB [Defluviimonas salinarum]